MNARDYCSLELKNLDWTPIDCDCGCDPESQLSTKVSVCGQTILLVANRVSLKSSLGLDLAPQIQEEHSEHEMLFYREQWTDWLTQLNSALLAGKTYAGLPPSVPDCECCQSRQAKHATYMNLFPNEEDRLYWKRESGHYLIFGWPVDEPCNGPAIELDEESPEHPASAFQLRSFCLLIEGVPVELNLHMCDTQGTLANNYQGMFTELFDALELHQKPTVIPRMGSAFILIRPEADCFWEDLDEQLADQDRRESYQGRDPFDSVKISVADPANIPLVVDAVQKIAARKLVKGLKDQPLLLLDDEQQAMALHAASVKTIRHGERIHSEGHSGIINSAVSMSHSGMMASVSIDICWITSNAPIDDLIAAIRNQEFLELPHKTIRPYEVDSTALDEHQESACILLPEDPYPDWTKSLPQLLITECELL